MQAMQELERAMLESSESLEKSKRMREMSIGYADAKAPLDDFEPRHKAFSKNHKAKRKVKRKLSKASRRANR